MDLAEYLFVAIAALLSAGAAVAFLPRFQVSSTPSAGHLPEDFSLLFLHNDLEHASPAALTALAGDIGITTWSDIHTHLRHRFHGMPPDPYDLADGRYCFDAGTIDDFADLTIEKRGASVEVRLIEADETTAGAGARARLLEAELQTLSRSSDTAPYPMWQTDDAGTLIWKNAAYDALALSIGLPKTSNAPTLFSDTPDGVAPAARRRAAVIRQNDSKTLWFDVSQIQSDGITISHAVDIEAVINAEVAQRNFVQTLAKTFAQLSTGLAIFDRNGRLALFNPALVDLTQLPAEFLSARPDLLSFFDRLREKRMMPEPKNYRSWRQEITDVIAAASDGRYQETWTLETGQTYRVSGRPHPDRAVAFLIEDISAEILVTRNFRAELDLGQSLIDTLPDGLALFSAKGVLTLHNQAYNDMWAVNPDASFADITVTDSIRVWKDMCRPTPLWQEIAIFVQTTGERRERSAVFKTNAGQTFECHIIPCATNATIIRFHAFDPETRGTGHKTVLADAE